MKTKEGDDGGGNNPKVKSHPVLCFNKEGMQWWQAGKVCLKVRQKERNSWRRSRLFPFLSKPDVFWARAGHRDRERKKQRLWPEIETNGGKDRKRFFFSWLSEPYGLYISPRRLVVSGCIRKNPSSVRIKRRSFE